ncbi:hypothetical protein ACFL2T_02670 [Elusimicrobiota bacterium]
MESIDAAHGELKIILADLEKYKDTIITESDTRLKIIDRILVEVLGWDRDCIFTEEASDSGYLDYFLVDGSQPGFILEAKRLSRDLGLGDFASGRAYKLSGPVFKKSDTQEDLEQTKGYCRTKSVQLGCLTSGNQWVIFLGNRIDGKSVDDGYGVTFRNLKEIEINFSLFWKLLSRSAVLDHNYQAYFRELEGTNIRHKLFYQPVRDATRSELKGRTKLATDLEPVFSNFFQNITGDSDKELLFKCFVESGASRDADKQIQNIALALLDNIRNLPLDSGKELQETIEGALKSTRGEFILILGAKGAGKSTFVERFFAHILRQELASRCLILGLDFKQFQGDPREVHSWINDNLLTSIEDKLFPSGSPEFEQLQGIFFSEYERWKKGEFKFLFDSDENKFKIKFGEYLFNLRETQKELYLERLLKDVVRNRKLLPCIILDNIDHFGTLFQDKVYQHARAIFEKCYTLIIFPTTDRTIWQLSKQGSMQSYFSKCFSLPTPSPKAVIKKRISYLKGKIEVRRKSKAGGDEDYFLSKGIRVKISDLEGFAACLEEMFINTDYVARWIGMLANFDIRRCLELCHDIICSPYIPIDGLIRTYISKSELKVAEHQILLAIIKGRHKTHLASENNFVKNAFRVDKEPPTSPLLNLRILQLLKDSASSQKTAGKAEEAYLTIPDIQEYFGAMNIGVSAVRKALASMMAFGLIESFDPTQAAIAEAERVRVSHSGVLHLEWSTGNPVFMSCMAEISPISERNAWDQLKVIYEKARPQWREICEVFAAHLLNQDKCFCLIPEHESYNGERALSKYVGNNWKTWFRQAR